MLLPISLAFIDLAAMLLLSLTT